MSLSFIPSTYPICHIARTITDTINPDTGNPVIEDQTPVIRYAQSISQIGQIRGSSEMVYSADFVSRIETDLHVSVADPTLYSPLDQIILFPDVDDDGDYVPDSGVAYFVEGAPYDGRQSPWKLFTKAFGGLIRIRRVT